MVCAHVHRHASVVSVQLQVTGYQLLPRVGMGATSYASRSSSQWLFPVSALQVTPSQVTSDYSLERELYDRARGIEFLYRLGSSLALFAFFSVVPPCVSFILFSI